MFSQTIDNNELAELPILKFPGRCVMVTTPGALNGVMDEFFAADVVGFDTETKPSFTRGARHSTALLQLSTQNTALLIKLLDVGLPQPIVDLLENDHVLKVGAAIRDDLLGLKRIRKFNPSQFIDLQHIAPQYGICEKSVRKLAAIVLNGRVSKKQQLSNWESDTYTNEQILYAATDAWVCREIYLKFFKVDANKACPTTK